VQIPRFVQNDGLEERQGSPFLLNFALCKEGDARPRGLKPNSRQAAYRSGEPLRHPKADSSRTVLIPQCFRIVLIQRVLSRGSLKVAR
jgi:hypothetical protein